MRLVTVRIDCGHRAGRQEGDEIVLLPFEDVGQLLVSGPEWRIDAGQDGSRISAGEAALAPVVPAPQKIICVGLNYRSHAQEIGVPPPEFPTIFAKFSTSLIGPADEITIPPNSSRVDWEAELALIIGVPTHRADIAGARAAIAGYTVANDVSMRDWQARTSQWLQGKTFDSSTPVGPALVTPDELGSPDALTLECFVDDEQVQGASTADLIFGPAEIVSYLSDILTLMPGDLILTGTPGGTGSARRPQRFLSPGQSVRTTITGVGSLTNRCIASNGEA